MKQVYVIAFLVGILASVPQALHMMDGRFQGVPVHLNTDEAVYYMHLQEPLDGRLGQAGKGIAIEHQREPSLAIAPIEEVYGLLFGWTGLNAAWVLQLMDFVMPALVFIILYLTFLACGFSSRQSMLGAVLFTSLQFYNLGRPINQRTTFLLMLLSILGIWRGIQGKIWWSTLGGVLMGVLVGVYLWGWTAVWCLWGVLLVLLYLQKSDNRWTLIKRHAVTGSIALVVAIPFFLRISSISSHPGYEDAVARSGVTHWRLPESWGWSGAFVLMAVGLLLFWWQRGRKQSETLVVALAVSSLGILNQQVVHGLEIMFRSHYLFYLTFAAIAAALFVYPHIKKSMVAAVVGFGALLIIGATAYEGRYVFDQFDVDDGSFMEQHLASLIPVLDDLDTGVFLSDYKTADFIPSHTHHYVVYNTYLQALLVDDEELTERYCLSIAPLSEEARSKVRPFIVNPHLHFDTQIRQERADLEKQLLSDICPKVHVDPSSFIEKYQVDYIVHDRKRQQNWDPRQLGVHLVEIESTDDWTLWKLTL